MNAIVQRVLIMRANSRIPYRVGRGTKRFNRIEYSIADFIKSKSKIIMQILKEWVVESTDYHRRIPYSHSNCVV